MTEVVYAVVILDVPEGTPPPTPGEVTQALHEAFGYSSTVPWQVTEVRPINAAGAFLGQET